MNMNMNMNMDMDNYAVLCSKTKNPSQNNTWIIEK